MGEVIGYYDPLYNAAPRNGAYLEVITTAIEEGAGSCVASDGGTPVAIGHIFGKTKLRAGSATYADQVINVAFSGTGTNNPNLFNGPWNDYPGAGWGVSSRPAEPRARRRRRPPRPGRKPPRQRPAPTDTPPGLA